MKNRPRLTDFDLFLHGKGTHYRAYEKLGAHLMEEDGRQGTYFAVWAPNAETVSVIGSFNNWEAWIILVLTIASAVLAVCPAIVSLTPFDICATV